MIANSFTDGFHHLEIDSEQVVAAHAGLAGDAGRHDADIGACNVGIIRRSLELHVEIVDRTGLGDIERFAFRNSFGDVEQDDIAELPHGRQMGQGSADHSGADKRDLLPSHEPGFPTFPIFTAASQRESPLGECGARLARWVKRGNRIGDLNRPRRDGTLPLRVAAGAIAATIKRGIKTL